MTYANIAEPDQTAAKEQSNESLHLLPFYKVIWEPTALKVQFSQKKVWNKVLKL